MGKKPVFGLASLFLAGAALTGCQANRTGYCQGNSCQPYGRGDTAMAQQNAAWNNRPGMTAAQGTAAATYATGGTGAGSMSRTGVGSAGMPSDSSGGWDNVRPAGTTARTNSMTPTGFATSSGNAISPPPAPVQSTTNSSPGQVPPLPFGRTPSGANEMGTESLDGLHSTVPTGTSGRAGTYFEEHPSADPGMPSSSGQSANSSPAVQPPMEVQSDNSVRMNDTTAAPPAPKPTFGPEK